LARSLHGARWIAAIFALSCSACGGDDAPSKPKADARAAPDATAKVAEPGYPNNAAGLTALLTDLLAARQAGEKDRTYSLTESLRLRDYETWFNARFGAELGARLTADYKIQFDDILGLADAIESLRDDGRPELSVERFEGSEDTKAVGYQVAALKAMKQPVALYSVRLRAAGKKKTFHIWSFVHDGKSFRYVGKMKPVAKAEITKAGDILEFRVADVDRIKRSLQ